MSAEREPFDDRSALSLTLVCGTPTDSLRHAVLSVLDAEDALRVAGVRSENAPKLLDELRHAVARVNAVNKALPRTSSDD